MIGAAGCTELEAAVVGPDPSALASVTVNE